MANGARGNYRLLRIRANPPATHAIAAIRYEGAAIGNWAKKKSPAATIQRGSGRNSRSEIYFRSKGCDYFFFFFLTYFL